MILVARYQLNKKKQQDSNFIVCRTSYRYEIGMHKIWILQTTCITWNSIQQTLIQVLFVLFIYVFSSFSFIVINARNVVYVDVWSVFVLWTTNKFYINIDVIPCKLQKYSSSSSTSQLQPITVYEPLSPWHSFVHGVVQWHNINVCKSSVVFLLLFFFAKKLNVVSKSVQNNIELDWLVARRTNQLVKYIQRKFIPFDSIVVRTRVCFTTLYYFSKWVIYAHVAKH